MHPLLDLTEMSDNQIIEKLALSSSRLMTVRKSGQSNALINQLKHVIMACQDELILRSEAPMENDPVAWDMDSYLERNKNDFNKPKENIPKWKSAALDQLGDTGDTPWG